MACAITARNFPAIADLPILRQWAGVVAQTPDGLPVIDGSTAIEGSFINAGHFFGNLAGAFSGRIVSEGVGRRAFISGRGLFSEPFFFLSLEG